MATVDTLFKKHKGTHGPSPHLPYTSSSLSDSKTSPSCPLTQSFDCLLTNLRDGLFFTTFEGQFQECNPAFEKMVGYSIEELREIYYHDITPRKWRPFEENEIRQQLLDQGFAETYEKEFIRKNGPAFFVELNLYLEQDQEGIPKRVWGIARDITKHKRAERFATRRLRKLHSLHDLSNMVIRHFHDLDAILQEIVELLPRSWQPAESCRARLVLRDQEYTTAHFRTSRWKLASEIRVKNEAVGTLEVYYQRESSDFNDASFVEEEQQHIDLVARRAGKIIERIETQRKLQSKQLALEEANAALHRILTHLEEEKSQIHDSVATNVDTILMPILHTLETEASLRQKFHLRLLKKSLKEITSPFASKLSNLFESLTSVEIEICKMIRDGFNTKEIARLRHVSPATIRKQRERIRRKLGLSGKSTNLASHLCSISAKDI